MSESLYCLEVLVQTAEMPTDVSAKVVTRDPENRAHNFPRAVALRLLDFPLLVIKRDPEQPHVGGGGNQTSPGDTSLQPGDGAAATAPGDGAPPSLKEVLFDCGKSCLFRSNPTEMEALLRETPMYVMYLDVSNPRKPKLLSTGRMPLSVHYSQAHEHGTWDATEEEDAQDTEMSPDAEGFARMVVPMYTEMGQPRGRISLCARLSCHGPALLSHVEALHQHHHYQQQQEHQFLEVGPVSYAYGHGGVAGAAHYAAAGAPLAGPGPPMPGARPIQQQEEQRNRALEAFAEGAAAKRAASAAAAAHQEEEKEEANDRARFEQVVTAQHRKAALRVAVGGGASRRTQPPVLVYYNDPEGSGDQSSCEEDEEVPSEEAQMRRSYGALGPREDSGARGYGHGGQDHGEAGYARGFETSSHQRGYLQSSPPARSEEHGSLSPPWLRGRNGSPRGYSRYSCYPEEHPGDAAPAHRRRRNSPGPGGAPHHQHQHHHHQQQQPGRIDSRAAGGLKSSLKSRRGLPGPRRGRRHHLTHPGPGAGHHHLLQRQQPSLGLPGRGGGHTAARAAARRRPSPAEGSPPPPPDPASSLRRSLPLSAYPTYPRGDRAPYHYEYHQDGDQGSNSFEYYSEDGHYQDDLEEGLRGSQGHPGPAVDIFQTPPPSAAATPARHPSFAPRLAATSAPPATGHGSPMGKGQPRTPGRESMSRFHTEEFPSSPDSPGPRGVVHFSSPPPAWGGTTGVATTDLGSTAGPRGHIHVDTPPPLWAGAATPGSTRLRDPRTPASAGHSTGFHLFGGSRDGLQAGVPFSAGPGASGGRLMVLTPDGTLWPAAAAAAAAASSLAPGHLQNHHHYQEEDTSLRTQAPQSVPQGMPSVEQAQEAEKGPPEGRPSAALTKEQRANAGALADLVREGGVVGALVQELAALLRLRSVGEQSALIRADLEALLGSPLPSKGPLMRGTPARTAWAEAGAASAAETLVALLARSQSQGGPPVAALPGMGAQQQQQQKQQRSQATANNLARMEAWQDGSEDHYSADGFESEARGSSVSPTERRKDASRGLQAHPQLQISSSFSIMDAAAPGQVSEGLEGLAAAAFTYKGSSSSSSGGSNGSRSRSRSSGDRDNKEDDEGSVYSDAFLRASGEGLATGASEWQPAAAAPAGAPESSASDTPRQQKQQQQQQHLPALGVGSRQASTKHQALTESSLSTLLDSILEEDRSVASSVRHSGEKPRQDPDHTISVESFARSSGSASSPSISDSSSGNTHSGASYSDDTISDDTLSTVSSSHDGASSRDAQPPVNRRDTKPATVTMAPSSSPYNRSNQPPRQVGAPVVSAVRRRV